MRLPCCLCVCGIWNFQGCLKYFGSFATGNKVNPLLKTTQRDQTISHAKLKYADFPKLDRPAVLLYVAKISLDGHFVGEGFSQGELVKE